MADFRGIQGTPWHVERYHIESDDHRRHRSNCCYYDKQSKECCKRMTECYGASHCKYYQESEARITKEEWKRIISETSSKGVELNSADMDVVSSDYIAKYLKGITGKQLNELSFNAFISFIECMKKSLDYIVFFERNRKFLDVLGLAYGDKKHIFETIMRKCVYLDGRNLKMYPHRVFKTAFLKLSEDERV